MTIYRKTEKAAMLSSAVIAVAFAVIISGVVAYPGLGSYALACIAGVALMPGLITIFHATITRLAEQERASLEAQKDDSLFDGDRAGSEIKRRNLRQFESWGLPTSVAMIALVELLSGIYLLKMGGDGAVSDAANVPAVAGAAAVLAVTLYLVGSYFGGVAFHGKQPMLRAVASEMSLIAWLCGVFALVTLAKLTQLAIEFDTIFGIAVAVLLLVRATDRLICVILDIYRPRKFKDGTNGLLYESKFSIVVADPVGLLASLSRALHYQFGIRISEEGLLRLFFIGVPLVIGMNIALLALFSCIVVINPGERAVVERFGRLRQGAELFEPGLHFKLPWPVDTLYRHNVAEIKSLSVGADESDEDRMLWTDSGTAAFEPFLAPAELSSGESGSAALNLISVELFIQYRISSIKDYIYNCGEPEAMLKALIRRQMTRDLGGYPFFDTFLSQRDTLAKGIQSGLQKRLDDRRLGVEIVTVGWRFMQPPSEVAKYYQDVVGGAELRAIQVINARREVNALVTKADTDREKTVSEAKAFRDQQVSVARADAASFTRLLPLYKTYGKLMKARIYFSVMDKARDRRKLIVATEADQQLIRLDLKKSKSELFEFAEEPQNE